jgi:hypothetical protein
MLEKIYKKYEYHYKYIKNMLEMFIFKDKLSYTKNKIFYIKNFIIYIYIIFLISSMFFIYLVYIYIDIYTFL